MTTQTRITPNRNVINGVNAPLLENTLVQRQKQRKSNQSLLWGAVNIAILSIILYDLSYTCPLHFSYIQYVEYILVVVLSLNILYHFGRYLMISLPPKTMASPALTASINASSPGTPPRKPNSSPTLNLSPNISVGNTPMNTSAMSWMTNSTPSDSYNFSVKSDSWLYAQGSPPNQNVPSQPSSPRQDTSGITFISDEDSLKTYLKDFEENEKKVNTSAVLQTTGNPLSSFWSHPVAKGQREIASFLKRCQYQLSSPITTKEPLTKGSPTQGLETWRRLSVDIVTLTHWNSNLRTWLSQTILCRLVNEIEYIDKALIKQGLNDIQVGKVGLDRLRKTSQTGQVLQYIPTLSTVIPFLEMTPNQEYLVNRIKELAKGGCMGDFRWNSGSSSNGKDWDTSLPTDSALMMHLFASYMDTQLLPLPNQPDVKPFTGYHYIKLNDKLPVLTDETLVIQQCSEHPPHYRVAMGTEVYELVKGYNNLFHAILLFLYLVQKKFYGMIGRVNLDRSGVNMLWIIQSGANNSKIN